MANLKFRYGSMNSSKSANLIMEWYNHISNGKSSLVFKPSLDTRGESFITSRALHTVIPAHVISKDNVGVMFKAVQEFSPSIVFVDEINFFSKEQVEELADIVDKLGVPVRAFGLLTTFKGEMFEGSKRMVELADEIERIKSECTRCSNEGLINSRQVDGRVQIDGETVVVGAEEIYSVLCRKCFNESVDKEINNYTILQ